MAFDIGASICMTFGVPITYLLTEEKQKNGETENAKQFLQRNQQFIANNDIVHNINTT